MPGASRRLVRRAAGTAAAAAAAAAAMLAAAPPGQAQDCPPESYLAYGSNAYVAEIVPSSEPFPRRGELGRGLLDLPAGVRDGRCAREQVEAQVLALEGIDPLVAVAVEGRPEQLFVLGNKCARIGGTAHWACLRSPLGFEGRSYVATAYPPDADAALPLGEPVGEATLGGERVEVVAIEGVEPAVAVGRPGEPDTAYVAVGACQYERFATPALRDDLRRCLEGPVWFVFDPAGGPPGTEATARADRALSDELDGASVALVRSEVGADVVPRGGAQAEVFRIAPAAGREAAFTVPDLPPGRYEAVVHCERCAAGAGGESVFPAGAFLIVEEGGGLSGSTIALVAIGVVFAAALLLSAYMWHRARTLRRAAGGAGDDGGIS